jgi:shikimate dehydrogenase
VPPPTAPLAPTFALLGDPVEHSLSPRLHNAAFAAAGIAASYRSIRVGAAELVAQLRALALAGGGGNVTVPHKRLAVTALDVASPMVRRTGAVNTFWLGPGGVHGDNTDVAGFHAALAHHDVHIEQQPVLLLGAGGAAAAVLLALLQAGSTVTIVNRSAYRARELIDRMTGLGVARWAEVAPPEPFAAVVNATSLGLRPDDPHPLPVARVPDGAAVIDLVYSRGGTSWVRAAAAAGRPAFDGAEMLLRQAAAAFTIWTGLPAPLEAMRTALGSNE